MSKGRRVREVYIKKLIFWVLCLLEYFYRAGFWAVTRYKRFRGGKGPFSFTTISVGNLSVGGTGKSVVVGMLVDLLGAQRSAIILRGYRGSAEKSGKSVMISDGQSLVHDASVSGDEAMMHAASHKVPVIVGPDRGKSGQLLEDFCKNQRRIDFAILDDAYQNCTITKNIEILLLDARAPFDNGHCLPAGMLRERDYSRADIIILTHADEVSSQQLQHIKKDLLPRFAQDRIFSGAHVPAGIFYHNTVKLEPENLARKRFLVAAGIGSFNGLRATLERCGVIIGATRALNNHHDYTIQELEALVQEAQNHACDGIIVTAKDWVKISPLIALHAHLNSQSFYVIRVMFEFLSQQERDSFAQIIASQKD